MSAKWPLSKVDRTNRERPTCLRMSCKHSKKEKKKTKKKKSIKKVSFLQAFYFVSLIKTVVAANWLWRACFYWLHDALVMAHRLSCMLWPPRTSSSIQMYWSTSCTEQPLHHAHSPCPFAWCMDHQQCPHQTHHSQIQLQVKGTNPESHSAFQQSPTNSQAKGKL